MPDATRNLYALVFSSLVLAGFSGPVSAQNAPPSPAAPAVPKPAAPSAPVATVPPTVPAASATPPAKGAAAPAAAASAPKSPDINASLHALIGKIRAQHDEANRGELAGQLVDLMSGANTAAISTGSIDELAGLLNNSSQMVRYWSALALAQVGPPASRAVPALQKALTQAQKGKTGEESTGTVADGICIAFARIGTTDSRCTNSTLTDTPQVVSGGGKGGRGAKTGASAPRARRGK